MEPRHFLFVALAIMTVHILSVCAPASASTTHMGTSSNYRTLLKTLKPGDHLRLAPGDYKEGLPVHYLYGTPDARITISGSNKENRTIFLARPDHNTISILNSSYIVLRDLDIDGNNLSVDGVKCEGHAEWAHHITLDGLRVRGHGNNQQIAAISTKCPAWDWIIRNNIIEGAGTGLYLGNSDGRAPFVAGLIEHNLIVDTIGYNLQIKHQTRRPMLAGMPQQHSTTIIRHNVFSKANGGSKESARPNVLVGHWPLAGVGSNDLYLIYGNFFYQNPHESLFQGEGNIALYNNLFVNYFGDAARIQPHLDTPRAINVFHNTVVAKGAGIRLVRRVASSEYPQFVVANVVFSGSPVNSAFAGSNLVGKFDEASNYLARPFAPLGEMNLSPLAAALPKATRNAEGIPHFTVYPDADRDFDGSSYSMKKMGAYASEKALRWLPVLEIKPVPVTHEKSSTLFFD